MPTFTSSSKTQLLTLMSSRFKEFRYWWFLFHSIGGLHSPVMAQVSTALWPTVTVLTLTFWSSGSVSRCTSVGERENTTRQKEVLLALETSRLYFYLHLLLLLQLLTTTHRDKSHCEDSCLAHIFLLMKPANNKYEIQVSQLASRGAVKRKMFFSVTDAARRRNYCNLQKKGKELSLMFCKYSGWFMRRYNYESRISSLTASASISMWPSGTKQTLLGGTGLLTLKIFSERLDCFRHAQCLNKTRMYIHSFWRR